MLTKEQVEMPIKVLAKTLGHDLINITDRRPEVLISCLICNGLWFIQYFRDNQPKCEVQRPAKFS